MKKLILIGVVVVAVIFAIRTVLFINTKSYSPEATAEFKDGETDVKVYYNSPSKKGRVIFGGLVPYGVVWRTGANEATVLETNRDLSIQGKKLAAGQYTLWTIPGEQSWKVIFNSETGQWGIDFNGEANRDPENDVLAVDVPARMQEKEIEKFTISLDKADNELQLILLWDKTVVTVPMVIAQ